MLAMGWWTWRLAPGSFKAGVDVGDNVSFVGLIWKLVTHYFISCTEGMKHLPAWKFCGSSRRR